MRMPVDDFLKLTTPDDATINKIIAEGPTIAGLDAERNPLAEFDPSITDQTFYQERYPSGRFREYVNAPQLYVDTNGRIFGHNGRHRAALLKKAGGTNIPVLFDITPNNNRGLENIFNNKFTIQDYKINNLLPQDFKEEGIRKNYQYNLQNSKVTPFKIKDRTGDGDFELTNLQELLNTAQAPDTQAQDVPLFSRAATKDSPAYLDLTKENLEYTQAWAKNETNLTLPFVARIPINDFLLLTTDSVQQMEELKLEGPLPADVLGDTVGYGVGLDDIGRQVNTKFDPKIFNKLPRRMTSYVGAYPFLQIDENGKVTGHEGRHRLALGQKDGAVDAPVIIMFKPTSKALSEKENIYSATSLNDLGITSLLPQVRRNVGRIKLKEQTSIIDDANINQALAIATFPDGIQERQRLNNENKQSALFSIQQIQSVPANLRNDLRYSAQLAGHYDNLIDLGYLESSPQDIPLFSRASRNFSDGNSNESIKRREAVKVAEERTKETPRGDIPFYNINASDIALEAAIEFNQDPLKTAPDDIPTFSRAMPSNLQEAADTVGVATPKQSQATRLIDFASDPINSIKKRFKNFRTNYIDKLDAIEKRIVKGSAENEEVRLANNTADTATVAAIRMADRARGIFQQMLLKGIPVDQIEGMPSLTKVIDLEINTRYNPLIEGDTSTGGLMQILSALQSDPEVDLEGVFSLYAKLKRVKKLNEKGEEIASPITSKELQAIETIEREHPVVVEAYNNYQKWNNALVDFASRKGLLDSDQAAKWIEHSSYYPFYRTMVDDANITAPTIAGGSLPNNPLNMPMKGSEEKIDVDPIEAISRNSLSILTAAMKNDGTMKLLRDLETLGEARVVSNTKLAGINSVFVFENGNKKHYQVDDIDTYMAMQSIGGVKPDGLMKIFAMSAGLLRDTVTRDPGFVFVNVFRDTISAAVTSGAPLGGDGFTPIIDSFKNLFGDISSLEEFGVIGGYDFANDEGDVKDFLNRARRRAGLSPNNGLRPDVAFYKLWDGLGHLTTKSDGATRKAVADAVYKKLIKEGYTEAQAQSEAAYQGLEIINFGRRGQSSMFRILTTSIPFLNARVQGLDVLYRSFSGKYSAQDKLQEGGTLEDLQGMIMRRALMRLGVMIGTTAMYYALVSDTDEYKAEKLEKRDDNYIIPIGGGNVIYLPIAFEVGMLTKAIPERLFDLMSGEDAFSDTSLTDFKDSTVRQLSNSLNIPFLGGDIGIQAFKPIFEAVTNRASFTNTEIVPYFMAKEKPAYQSRQSTNEIFRMMGEALNISPIKLEYIFKGYTGTLGGYALTITDALARSVTGTPLMPPNIKQIPVAGRFFGNQERMGGLQQQFYKLREEVNTAVTTMNSLREDGRMDELYAYRNQVQGLLNAKGQVRAIDRYMRNWRKRRDRILNRTDINANVRSDMLLDLQIERDKRLAMIPELRQKADIPPDTVGVILR
jgi:hypothetical protein